MFLDLIQIAFISYLLLSSIFLIWSIIEDHSILKEYHIFILLITYLFWPVFMLMIIINNKHKETK